MSDKQIRYAVLNFGFAESYRLGSLVLFNQDEPFTSEEVALNSLAEDLFAMYKQDSGFNEPVKSCCAANPDSKFCPECGLLIGELEVHPDDFQEWLFALMERDLDSVLYLEDDVQERDVVWSLGTSASELVGLTSNEVLVLNDYSERKLCELLGLED